MALPAQVRKQAEAVNKLYEELNVDTGEQGQEAEGPGHGPGQRKGALRRSNDLGPGV